MASDEWRMERFVFGCVAVAGIGSGLGMAVRPGCAALRSRDDGDSRPPTAGEIWAMRVVGALLVAGCWYGLYAILTGMPGAEGPPLP